MTPRPLPLAQPLAAPAARPGARRSRRRNASAFTLLEVLMVVAIIVILLSLVVGGSYASIQWARARQLQATFAQLDAIVDGYFQQTGKYFVKGDPNPALNIDTMHKFITEAQRVVGTPDDANNTTSGDADMVSLLGNALRRDPPPSGPWVVIDPWGRPILFYNPNELNTVVNRGGSTLRPFFVSTGPDGVMDSNLAVPWALGQAYAVGSKVILGQSTYTATAAHTSSNANTPGSSSGPWTRTDDIVSAGGTQQ